jgi:hypothetical protein
MLAHPWRAMANATEPFRYSEGSICADISLRWPVIFTTRLEDTECIKNDPKEVRQLLASMNTTKGRKWTTKI